MKVSQRMTIIIACLVTPGAAGAFCLNWADGAQDPGLWKRPVTYHVSQTLTDPELLQAIDAAFQSWASVECTTLEFSKGDSFAIETVPFQFHRQYGIYIFFFSAAEGYPTGPEYTTHTSVGTTTTGALSEASIALNGFAYDWATDGDRQAIDMQGEMTRLIGAVIGLKTSNVANSVMHHSPNFGNTEQRQLKPDDIAAIQHLYYVSECGVFKPVGADRCSADGDTPAQPSPAEPDPPSSGGPAAPSEAEGSGDALSPPEPGAGGGCHVGQTPSTSSRSWLPPGVLLLIAAYVTRRLGRAKPSNAGSR